MRELVRLVIIRILSLLGLLALISLLVHASLSDSKRKKENTPTVTNPKEARMECREFQCLKNKLMHSIST